MTKPTMTKIGYGGESAGTMREVLMYVIHETEGYEAGDLAVLGGADDRHVSIHFYITRKGVIYESVPLTLGANHVGPGGFVPGHPDAVARVQSIGIEMENPPTTIPYTEIQLQKLDELIAWLDTLYPSKPPIYGHREVRPPGDKDDPRKYFPLANYKTYRKHTAEKRTYKVMALSTAHSGKTSGDFEFEVKLLALCKQYGKALYETSEKSTLPPWTSGWWRKA